jgi:MoaA/NifB/PqqE/SkfB family radical SAM enzyme
MGDALKPDFAWKIGFLRGFLSGDRAYAGPYTAAIDVTRRCNLRCVGCRSHAPEKAWCPDPRNDDFSWEEFVSVCRQLQAMGTRKMILIGEGEPTLHPRLLDMIASAKNAGLFVTLVTNGTMLDAAKAQSLVKSGLDELRISLWAADEAEYGHNCPGTDTGFFLRVLDGARSVVRFRRENHDKGPRVVLHRPIEREHFRSLGRMVEVACETGCDALSFSPLKPLGGTDTRRALLPEEELEVQDILASLHGRARAHGLETNVPATLARYRIGREVWRAMPCYIGWIDMRIRTTGDVLACSPCRRTLGNIRQSGLAEIWNGLSFRQFRRETRTRAGLARMARNCACEFCCHALTNARLHRALKWMPRFA